jgi:hypothetical protein
MPSFAPLPTAVYHDVDASANTLFPGVANYEDGRLLVSCGVQSARIEWQCGAGLRAI